MISFLISMCLLVVGYMVYGRIVERIFGPDNRLTPAVAKAIFTPPCRFAIASYAKEAHVKSTVE